MLYQEKGVKACETHWHVELGRDVGGTYVSKLSFHNVSAQPKHCLLNFARADPLLCVAWWHFTQFLSLLTWITSSYLVPQHPGLAYFQLTFHWLFVEMRYVRESYAEPVVEGLYPCRPVHFSGVFPLVYCRMHYETKLCSLLSLGLWDSCVIPWTFSLLLFVFLLIMQV